MSNFENKSCGFLVVPFVLSAVDMCVLIFWVNIIGLVMGLSRSYEKSFFMINSARNDILAKVFV